MECRVQPLYLNADAAPSPQRTMARSALCFCASFLACCLIAPGGLGGNGGLSDFGGHVATFVPYWVGLWSLAFGMWRVASHSDDRLVQLLLRVVSVLVGVVVFTFSSLGPFFNTTHVVFGTAAFTLSLVVSLCGTLRPSTTATKDRRALARCSLALEMLAWGLAALWLFEVRGHLLWAQFVFFVAFLMNAMTWLGGAEPTPDGDTP